LGLYTKLDLRVLDLAAMPDPKVLGLSTKRVPRAMSRAATP
jgi:hypothetical protein